MTLRKRLLIGLPFLVSLLACQFLSNAQEKLTAARITPTPAPTRTSRPAVSPTPAPTTTFTQTLDPATQTPLPDTPTPAPTHTPIPAFPSATPLSISLQLDIFDELWTIVNEEYLYPDFNGLDWKAIQKEYLTRIQSGLSNAEFYTAMDEMIFRLGDDHSFFLSPDQVVIEDAEYQGTLDYSGIGVLLSAVPERQRAVVLAVFPGYPAEQAGLRSRDSILTVNGEPILMEDGSLRDTLRGPEDTLVTLTVQTPGQVEREIILSRSRVNSPYPVPYQILTSPAGKRIAYILILTFTDKNTDERVEEAMRSMAAEGPLDGIIIDNTQNRGGSDTVMNPILSYFTSGKLGAYISRNRERTFTILRAKDIQGSQSLPLVILVGLDTVSYGEIFAGILQDAGRAYVIGETTGGNVETLWGYDFEDGSRAWIAHEFFRPLHHPEANWEDTGIVPDLTAQGNWDEFTVEDDPRVKAALEYFDSR